MVVDVAVAVVDVVVEGAEVEAGGDYSHWFHGEIMRLFILYIFCLDSLVCIL